MTRYKKGQSGNPKGRPRGSTNEKTRYIREWVISLIGSNAKTLGANFNRLPIKEQFKVITQLMPYVLPRQVEQNLKHNIDFNNMTDEQLDDIINTMTQTILNNGTDE